MPARWTGAFVGELHNRGISVKQISEEAGLNPKYVSTVLNSEAESPKAAKKLNDALDAIIARRAKSE